MVSMVTLIFSKTYFEHLIQYILMGVMYRLLLYAYS